LEVGKYRLDVDGQWRKTIRILTKYGFNSRFTLSELVGLQGLSKTDDVVAVLMNKFNIAEEIDLDDPGVLEGMSYLVSAGAISEARANEILA
jgi:hypothetical protein